MLECEHPYTREEMMTVAAARLFRDRATCFVGVGLPGVAACLARACDAPGIVLVYESGAIGAKPSLPPLSIADPELATTADFLVGVPEIFSYWLQGGKIDMAFLGAAQVDRFGNMNTTVIGDYRKPKVRMPGGGGAPEIATNAREVVVIVRQSLKTFVSDLHFRTTRGDRVRAVVTDLGIWQPDSTGELALSGRHPGVSMDEIRSATGWPVRVSNLLQETAPPAARELFTLRSLHSQR
jgi:glutaconate CoA-transferase, subunit B